MLEDWHPKYGHRWRGGDSYVMAHVESPAVLLVMGILAGCGRSRGNWGILGRDGGGEDDDRHAPSGRGRRPCFRMTGETNSETLPSLNPTILLNSWSGIGRYGKGAMILGGRCSSGMPLYGSTGGGDGAGEFVGTVRVGIPLACNCRYWILRARRKAMESRVALGFPSVSARMVASLLSMKVFQVREW